jgi:two-component system, cell cycle sensor histidine kinase and response regulator CckA
MPTSHSGTILIVDDEDGIRATLRQQLAAQGHTVLEASHGIEALALVRMQPGRVELVLADVVMPEMNGTELAATLQAEYPDLPVILMSAYAPAGWTRVGIHQSIVPVLMKPFTSDQLAELIQIALDLPGKRRRTSQPTALL